MRRKHLIYALIFSCLLGSSIALIAYSQSVAALRTAVENAENHLETWNVFAFGDVFREARFEWFNRVVLVMRVQCLPGG